jgi:hypothetical protein
VASLGGAEYAGSFCGSDGAEITTYESLDVSLGQARNNLYISVKALAAWTLLEQVFGATMLNAPEWMQVARNSADLSASAITAQFDPEVGMFPAVFEDENRSRILPAVEGLVFPLFLGFVGELNARYSELFGKQSQHMQNALQSGVCLDATTGLWKISSTSQNTWFSKIAIAQHVVRKVFPDLVLSEAATSGADAAHARVQQSAAIGQFAMVDQVHSSKAIAIGSRYYPRCVTTCLWMRDTN